MGKPANKKTNIEKAGEDLFTFAIDREGVKWLMEHLAEEAEINRAKVEYELQILKIISVGWSLSYFLENSRQKSQLVEHYWAAINEFSKELSSTTELMTGQDIDYFQTLKDRLDVYVEALSRSPDAQEPATVIGPEFANICGNSDDIHTFMAGSKMFSSTISKVKEYLEAIKLR